MLGIGVPQNLIKNKFANVKMERPVQKGKIQKGPGNLGNTTGKNQDKFDENFLKKLNGNKGKNPLYKKKSNRIGKNEFLNLLTHQLKHQDPFKPMDQNKFAAELAQFSQLEQLTHINEALKKKEERVALENKYFAASFLGKKVQTGGSDLFFKGEGNEATISYDLKDDAELVRVRVFDNKNNLIGQFDKEQVRKGNNEFRWDGSTLDGQKAQKGFYSFQVKAWDESLSPVEAISKVSGIVTGVKFGKEGISLVVNGRRINLYDIKSFESSDKEKKDQESADEVKKQGEVMLPNNS